MHWSADLPHRDRQAPDRCFAGTSGHRRPAQHKESLFSHGGCLERPPVSFLTHGASRVSSGQNLSASLSNCVCRSVRKRSVGQPAFVRGKPSFS